MPEKRCRACDKIVTGSHYCEVERRRIEEDDSSFIMSAVIGYATDSAIVGGLLGGDFVGGFVGQAIADDQSSTPNTNADSWSGNDSSSGGDFGGGGGGGDFSGGDS